MLSLFPMNFFSPTLFWFGVWVQAKAFLKYWVILCCPFIKKKKAVFLEKFITESLLSDQPCSFSQVESTNYLGRVWSREVVGCLHIWTPVHRSKWPNRPGPIIQDADFPSVTHSSVRAPLLHTSLSVFPCLDWLSVSFSCIKLLER